MVGCFCTVHTITLYVSSSAMKISAMKISNWPVVDTTRSIGYIFRNVQLYVSLMDSTMYILYVQHTSRGNVHRLSCP